MRAENLSKKISSVNIICGALINGRDWIFLLIKFNDNCDGASYQQPIPLEYAVMRSNFSRSLMIPGPWPDLIAAILSQWIQNSFVDLGSDDWFEVARRR
ncbi:hypothetical protein BDR04DRAFT_1097387 [Suillus decipiens]|nr:hypothetical protein BDR04DRAFT_1097387 [Suillus decipiens]